MCSQAERDAVLLRWEARISDFEARQQTLVDEEDATRVVATEKKETANFKHLQQLQKPAAAAEKLVLQHQVALESLQQQTRPSAGVSSGAREQRASQTSHPSGAREPSPRTWTAFDPVRQVVFFSAPRLLVGVGFGII